MKHEQGLSKNQIIEVLIQSRHGALVDYVPIAARAVEDEPEFMAHLIAWNAIKGSINDSKVALPIISLASKTFDAELVSNSLAHLAQLSPKELLRAVKFARFDIKLRSSAKRKKLFPLVRHYLEQKEKNFGVWDHVAAQHRRQMHDLYKLSHFKGKQRTADILFKRDAPFGSIFADIKNLAKMPLTDAAATILNRKIPFLVVTGTGVKVNDPDVLVALINGMSATEVVTNSAMLIKLGVQQHAASRAAFELALEKVRGSKKNVLKTTRAAENVSDAKTAKKLKAAQEKQIDTIAVEGNWLVLGDRSSSMTKAIEAARQISAIIARAAKGRVHLVFFNESPTGYDVTGKTYEEITEITRRVTASGATSIGCGLKYALESKLEFDAIAIVSDGGENRAPVFCYEYERVFSCSVHQPPIYLYLLSGDTNTLSDSLKLLGIDHQVFNLRGANADFYSFPNLVQTMRVKRYSLIDEIMATPLLNIRIPTREKRQRKVTV